MNNFTTKFKIGLVTMAPFPIGNVSTIRFTSYLEALVKRGIPATVIIYTPTNMAKHITTKKGLYKNINYKYATKITWGRLKNRYIKALYLVKGLLSTLRIIQKDKLNTIILYGDNPTIVNLVLKCGSILLRFRLVGDRSEYPSLRQRGSKLRLAVYKFKNSLLNGMIVMTKELKNYYSQIIGREDSTFLLPMTMDMHRFDNTYLHTPVESYIAVVFGTHNRDGLYETIRAYFKYKDMGGKYVLKIIGDFESMPNKKELRELINSSDYQVEILGKKNILEVPEILANASCLMTTPNSYVSGGFPTKLGEYMLSGVPVIATKVGELEEYLTDSKDVLFAEAGDINGIAKKILWIENNFSDAERIADNAKITAKKFFSADSYADNLIKFLRPNLK